MLSHTDPDKGAEHDITLVSPVRERSRVCPQSLLGRHTTQKWWGRKKFQDEKRSEWDAVDKIHSEE